MLPEGTVLSVVKGGEYCGKWEILPFPEKKLYVFLAINLGTVTDSPLHAGVEKARDEVFEVMLR
ncbi:MAG: hypothetical protein H6557_34590 [Lewinellaceae bacterium]|nr:hypothetical protein [Phaeodactylibacter sp.]MCB9041772.1 hypothetical protein [Lewinellaceae bacterium]